MGTRQEEDGRSLRFSPCVSERPLRMTFAPSEPAVPARKWLFPKPGEWLLPPTTLEAMKTPLLSPSCERIEAASQRPLLKARPTGAKNPKMKTGSLPYKPIFASFRSQIVAKKRLFTRIWAALYKLFSRFITPRIDFDRISAPRAVSHAVFHNHPGPRLAPKRNPPGSRSPLKQNLPSHHFQPSTDL
jgi:hypothetical protein